MMLPDTSSTSSSRIFYIPRWVRVTIVCTIVIMFLISCFVLFFSLSDRALTSWTIAAVSMIELAGTAFLALVVLFFVERGQRVPRVEQLSREFFLSDVPAALEKMDYIAPSFQPWNVAEHTYSKLSTNVRMQISYAEGNYLCDYIVFALGTAIFLRLETNVKRVGVVYKVNKTEDLPAEDFFSSFQDTIEGAKDAGYHIGIPRDVSETDSDLCTQLNWRGAMVLPLHLNRDEGFIYNDVERQYVAQDLSIMTKALIHEGLIDGRLQKL